jgi:uncharacterized protein
MVEPQILQIGMISQMAIKGGKMTEDPKLTQALVEEWLSLFIARLREAFGDRLVYAGYKGSWARGEGRPDSDIDAVVVLDRIETQDLAAYLAVVKSMPDGGKSACGVLMSVPEVRNHEPRCELAHFYYGCKPLHGTLEGFIAKPTPTDLVQEIRFRMANTLHNARHKLALPHDLGVKVHGMRSEFKYVPLHLRWWLLLSTGTYHEATENLANALSDPEDREMLRIAVNWEQLAEDRNERPSYYIELLERWARSMLERVADYERSHGL